METRRHPQVTSLAEVEPVTLSHGEKFGAVRKRLAAASGARELGCSWIEVPPGRQAFPRHYHYGNEEAVFVLSGTGELRLGAQRIPIAGGDYVALPAGGPEGHAIVNTGSAPLQYLGISTAHSTDVVVYPDSGKFSAVGGADMHKGLKAAPFNRLLQDQPGVDYYLGED